MKIGIFIPGRLNSQRLPNKLILPIGDSCLWDIALSKLNSLPDKYEKVVLCNDNELIKIAKKYKNIKIIKRDESTKTDRELKYIYRDIEQMKSTYIMFLNPCQPMLKINTIISALEYFENNHLEYMESVVPFKNWVFNHHGRVINKMNYKTLSTKDVKTWYLDGNAFRIFPKDVFLKTGYMLRPNHSIYPISKLESIDIDTREDFTIAKSVYESLVR
jgi:CMP-N-acetylneuraminic acid synthetase